MDKDICLKHQVKPWIFFKSFIWISVKSSHYTSITLALTKKAHWHPKYKQSYRRLKCIENVDYYESIFEVFLLNFKFIFEIRKFRVYFWEFCKFHVTFFVKCRWIHYKNNNFCFKRFITNKKTFKTDEHGTDNQPLELCANLYVNKCISGLVFSSSQVFFKW